MRNRIRAASRARLHQPCLAQCPQALHPTHNNPSLKSSIQWTRKLRIIKSQAKLNSLYNSRSRRNLLSRQPSQTRPDNHNLDVILWVLLLRVVRDQDSLLQDHLTHLRGLHQLQQPILQLLSRLYSLLLREVTCHRPPCHLQLAHLRLDQELALDRW